MEKNVIQIYNIVSESTILPTDLNYLIVEYAQSIIEHEFQHIATLKCDSDYHICINNTLYTFNGNTEQLTMKNVSGNQLYLNLQKMHVYKNHIYVDYKGIIVYVFNKKCELVRQIKGLLHTAIAGVISDVIVSYNCINNIIKICDLCGNNTKKIFLPHNELCDVHIHNNHIYASNWNGEVCKYTLDGNLIETQKILSVFSPNFFVFDDVIYDSPKKSFKTVWIKNDMLYIKTASNIHVYNIKKKIF